MAKGSVEAAHILEEMKRDPQFQYIVDEYRRDQEQTRRLEEWTEKNKGRIVHSSYWGDYDITEGPIK
ncbi:MAG: hypothetical protein QMD85_04485 [Candidatus Aenigmarchaeota archaeon]|nr:hypothetical protein [Candidatus Aenigmarchaeota archaeon]MDI6722828.1 hypothetical protein [Candidatus Aenigmarchaeota archaeon]